MKYLKNFNESVSDLYQEVGDEYIKGLDYSDSVTINASELDRIRSKTGLKILRKINKMDENHPIKYCQIKINNRIDLQIVKLKDEYFIIRIIYNVRRNSRSLFDDIYSSYYKCDEIHGLVKFLNKVKNNEPVS